MEKTITLVGLYKDSNIGDLVIADCTEYLLKKELKDTYKLNKIDLDASINISFLFKVFRKLNIFKNSFFLYLKNQYKYNYLKNIDNTTRVIIVVGGGLIKFRYQYFAQQLSGLIEMAEDENIPVVLNAVGVEGYEEQDNSCKSLKKYLNSSTVKVITTRDDIETLSDKYLNNSIIVYKELVADPAVWAGDVYGVEKDISSQEIGIGLIRGMIFKNNEVDFTEEELIELYIGIILELEKRGLKYKLFTNGLSSDCELGIKVCKAMGRDSMISDILIPQSPKELVTIISSFKGVIASRLHACIISYSLNIPVIGLVWNDKLSFFGKNIGYENRFLNKDEFSAKNIVNKMEESIKEGYLQENMMKYKKTIKDSIDQIIRINKLK